jgi:poly-gamma-glutamate capsule biosynthesis protein CapA/YwtB (metallophosphatase superfamily)
VVSRRVRRRRRQFATGGVILVVILVYFAFFSGGGPKTTPPATHHDASTHQAVRANSPLNPDWKGNGKAVTLAFGGDVHFEGELGLRLTKNPATALGTTVSQLLGGSQLRMVNLESALTNGTCPQPQNKQYIFYAPPAALTALRNATVTLISQANDHAVDCGQVGLAQGLAVAQSANFPLVGAGATAAQAFAPYRTTIDGQRIAVLAATQVIPANLTSTWTATSTQGGVASALDPTQLIQAVQAARRTADTVVVFLDWGTETVACPNPQQEPLAEELVKAGADIVVGSGAHVLQGAGFLGKAYVEYGLGNFAFYDDTSPETDSGALLLTVEGRRILGFTFRPATILNGLPQPLTGAPAAAAIQSWLAARSCTNLSAAPTASLASEKGETAPFTLPTTTTTTAPGAGAGEGTGAGATTTTAAGGSAHGTTTTTTTAKPTVTQPTDNAG